MMNFSIKRKKQMSNQVKAALIVAFIMVACAGIIVIGTYLPWYVIPGIGLVYFIYIMYELILTKLEMDNKVSEIK